MSEGVTESQFYMWRAIFAIAHADGQITEDEEAFMDQHMRGIPFSLKQKAILEDDIAHAKDPGVMLSKVTDEKDQGTFFQFARLMCWSDGNYDAQEKEIMQRLLGSHMERLDVASLTKALSASKELVDKQHMGNRESQKSGFSAMVSRIVTVGKKKLFSVQGVDESRFYMWRSIFAMAHADGVVTNEESMFMQDTLNSEDFSQEQRIILERDMQTPQDPLEMFMQVENQEDRSRFFYLARMLCWSDGNFDEQEQEILLRLKSVHVRNVDINEMIGHVDMELANEDKDRLKDDMKSKNPFSRFLSRLR
jgi:uncharacterized membrane protein YebE (DUF533 family)